MTRAGPISAERLTIDYTRHDMERRMELLRFYAGDLERARAAEAWICDAEAELDEHFASETGSATVVATGTTEAALQKLVDIGQRHGLYTTDAATTQDADGRTEPRAIPDFLRRKTGEGNGVPSAARPGLDERTERAAQ